MKLHSFMAFAGFVMLIAASYSPLLRPFHLTNWDMYDCNKPYGIVVLLVAVVGITGVILMQPQVAKMAAWLSLALVILFYLLALMKIYTSFRFIPFHPVAKFMSRQIKFKWGWILLFTAPILCLAGTLPERPGYKIADQQ